VFGKATKELADAEGRILRPDDELFKVHVHVLMHPYCTTYPYCRRLRCLYYCLYYCRRLRWGPWRLWWLGPYACDACIFRCILEIVPDKSLSLSLYIYIYICSDVYMKQKTCGVLAAGGRRDH
jgi:hypothetical protein